MLSSSVQEASWKPELHLSRLTLRPLQTTVRRFHWITFCLVDVPKTHRRWCSFCKPAECFKRLDVTAHRTSAVINLTFEQHSEWIVDTNIIWMPLPSSSFVFFKFPLSQPPNRIIRVSCVSVFKAWLFCVRTQLIYVTTTLLITVNTQNFQPAWTNPILTPLTSSRCVCTVTACWITVVNCFPRSYPQIKWDLLNRLCLLIFFPHQKHTVYQYYAMQCYFVPQKPQLKPSVLVQECTRLFGLKPQ